MSTEGTSAWASQLKQAKQHGNNDPSAFGRAMQELEVIEARDKAFEDKIRTLDDLMIEAGLEGKGIQVGASLNDLATSYREAESKKKGNGRPALLAKLKDVGVDKLVDRQKLASALAKARNSDRLIPAKDDADVVRLKAKDTAAREAAAAAIKADRAKAAAAAEAETAASAAAAGPFVPLPPGTRVMMLGLLARPDLNGRHGAITEFNSEKGRYNVDVQGETVALKPANVTAVDKKPDAPAVKADDEEPVDLV